MLTPSTELNRWLGVLLLAALVAGCAGQPPQHAAAADTAALVHPDIADQRGGQPQADRFPELPDLDLAGELAGVPEPMAAPKVNRSNAMAFDQAVAALRAGQLREAEVLLLEITSDQPELAGPWVNLGQVYVLLDQFEEARMAFAKAVDANPRSCAAHNQLGVLSRQFGDFSAAEEHYRSCLVNVPNYKDAYLNLGILYELYLGKLPQALEAYRRYQLLAAEPDRRVQGWVMDLQRRLGV